MARQRGTPKTWLQVRFVCDAGSADALAECLSACGALSVSFDPAGDEPIYEPPPQTTPLWSSTRVSGLFPRGGDADALLAQIERCLAPLPLPAAELDVLEDRQWVQSFQEACEPRCFGGRLWLLPSWAPAPSMTADQVAVILDPGLAFGTRSHPTTRMCLDWLTGVTLEDREVVDYGCGSGILALAAARLGATRVWAVDTDRQALQAAAGNAERNGLDGVIQVREPRHLPALRADVVVSNILANTLCDLAGTLWGLLGPDGELALAGILAGQTTQVQASYAPWCTLRAAARCEDWVLLAGAREPTGA